MNSVVEDIANMLIAESSLDLTLGTTLFLYREPATPNKTVTLFETPGMPIVGLLTSDTDTKHYERPSLNIRVRDVTAQGAFDVGYVLIAALQARAQETWGQYLYSAIYATNSPFELDWDTNNRIRVSLNFNIQRRLI